MLLSVFRSLTNFDLLIESNFTTHFCNVNFAVNSAAGEFQINIKDYKNIILATRVGTLDLSDRTVFGENRLMSLSISD